MKAYKLVIVALEGVILQENDLTSYYKEAEDLLLGKVIRPNDLYIISKRDRASALSHYRDFLKGQILTREDYFEPFPNEPDAINVILKKKNLSCKDVIFIGGNTKDYFAACKAGVDFSMALWAQPKEKEAALRDRYTCCTTAKDIALYMCYSDSEENINPKNITERVRIAQQAISYDRNQVLDNIERLMAEHSFTQITLAKYINKTQESLSRMLNRKSDSRISLENLMLIAAALNVSVEELLNAPPKKRTSYRCDGFIEFNNKTHRIKSIKDLKKLTEELIYLTEVLPQEVKEIIDSSEKARKVEKDSIDSSQIVLEKEEELNPKLYDVWTFRKADDIKFGKENPLGNMCQGFPFSVGGVEFYGSEQAYIAGLFSHNTTEHIRIQQALISHTNGYTAKKEIRQNNTRFARKDWEEFNIQWMLYVVWEKCVQNEDFASLLKSVPKHAMIIENSSLQNGEKATTWGCKNEEWKEAHKKIEQNAEVQLFGKSQKEINVRTMNDLNKIDYIGVYKGKNIMGKILTICRDCLLYGEEPPINYELLRSKHIHILGQELKFEQGKTSITDSDTCVIDVLPTWDSQQAIKEAKENLFSHDLRTKVYQSNCEIIMANGYETANGKKVLLTDKERLQTETIAYSTPTDVSACPVVTEKTQTGVFEADCLLVAKALSEKGWNPAVLNLADEKSAGGFVHKGMCAQEEELCRRTTLTESLFPTHSEEYGKRIGLPVTTIAYPMNKDWGGIYSPNVTILRDVISTGYALLDNPSSISIISVAAVKNPTIDKEKLEIKMPKAIEREKNKMRTILRIGLLHGHDSLILGAFGCGAFHTPPSHIARLFAEIFDEPEFKNKYKGLFFAVLEGRKQEHNPEGNVKPFVDIFGKVSLENIPLQINN